jgi:hypothetical protein
MISITFEFVKSYSNYSEMASESLIYEMAELIIDYLRGLFLLTDNYSPTI